MRDPAEVHAARWETMVEFENHGKVRPNSIRPREPVTGEYVKMITTSARIFRLARRAVLEAEEQYDRDIEMRAETDGRVIDLAMPVRFSSAITDIATMMNRTNRKLSELRHRIEHLSDAAPCNGISGYEEQARIGLKNARKIAEVAELHPQTQLWLVWINESLSQASQIHYQMVGNDRFEDHGDQVLTYVAHPPLIVATVGCTATVEEVGVF